MHVMGMNTLVTSATNATIVVCTSSVLAILFLVSEIVPVSYVFFYFFVCLIGALIGKSIIDRYVKKTGHTSRLIFLLASIVTLATIGCFVVLFSGVIEQKWCLDGFHKYCEVESDNAEWGCPNL